MEHKLAVDLIIPYGSVTARGPSGTKVYQQGQIVPAGHTVLEINPPELAETFGLKTDTAKKAESKKGGEK